MTSKTMSVALIVRRACVIATVALLAGCGGGVDKDTTLDEVPQNKELKQSLREGFKGVLTEKETDCVGPKIFANKDLDVGQVLDFAKHPSQSGPVFEAYKAAFVACVDPSVKLPPTRVEGPVRQGVITGFKAAIPSLTDTQATCLIDRLYDAGIGVRELVLAGYLPETLDAMQPKIESAAGPCFN
jgi:hypothetical protein